MKKPLLFPSSNTKILSPYVWSNDQSRHSDAKFVYGNASTQISGKDPSHGTITMSGGDNIHGLRRLFHLILLLVSLLFLIPSESQAQCTSGTLIPSNWTETPTNSDWALVGSGATSRWEHFLDNEAASIQSTITIPSGATSLTFTIGIGSGDFNGVTGNSGQLTLSLNGTDYVRWNNPTTNTAVVGTLLNGATSTNLNFPIAGPNVLNTRTFTIPWNGTGGSVPLRYTNNNGKDDWGVATAITYQLCLPQSIVANDDNYSSLPINGVVGGTTASIFNDNGSGTDLVNGVAATNANVADAITVINNGGLTGVTIATNGVITVPAGTPVGTYIVEYRICVEGASTVCDNAFATLVVTGPPPCSDPLKLADNCDYDDDGISNINDLDDDNDGILDKAEDNCKTLSGSSAIAANAVVGASKPPIGWSNFGNSGSVDQDEGNNTWVAYTPYTFPRTLSDMFQTSSVTNDRFTVGFYTGTNGGWTYPRMESIYKNFTGLTIGKTYTYEFKGAITRVISPANGEIYPSSAKFALWVDYIAGSASAAAVPVPNSTQVLQMITPSTPTAYAETVSLSFVATQTSHNITIGYIPINFPSAPLFDFIGVIENGSAKLIDNSIVCDTDKDGIANSLDLDSDGDGCSDAIEGAGAFSATNLVASAMAGGNSGSGYIGTSANPVVSNLGNTVNTTLSSASYGVPTVAGAGQAVGTSDNGAVKDPSCCLGGIIAPTLTATTKSNVCPATTADISSLVSSTCPAGSTLEWHNVSTGFAAANIVSNPATVLAGMYYPVCYDATNTCYSPAPATGVTVTITSPCPPDTDGDGIADNVDLDDDNDGILDAVECAKTNRVQYVDFAGWPGLTSIHAVPYPTGGNVTINTVKSYKLNGVATPYNHSNGDFGPGVVFPRAFEGASLAANYTGAAFSAEYAGFVGTITSTNALNLERSLAPQLAGTYEHELEIDFTTTTKGTTDGGSLIALGGFYPDALGWNNEITISAYKAGGVLETDYTGWKTIFSDVNTTQAGGGTYSTPWQSVTNTAAGLVLDPIDNPAGYTGNEDTRWAQLQAPSNKSYEKIVIKRKLIATAGYYDFEYWAMTVGHEFAVSDCDTDKDGIVNTLDLDSDGDGCSDAIEGGASFTASDLVASSMAGGNSGSGYLGTSANLVVSNLGNTVNTTLSSASYGVPTIAGTGQTIGSSDNGAVKDPSCCLGGIIAPTLTATTKSNVCPATTADISSLVSSTCPAGSTLEWHNVSTGFSASNKVADATIVGAGTYYPVCYDATNTCYSPAPATGVTVTIITDCVDTDGDGITDINDLDDDNDGILDTVECTFQPAALNAGWTGSGNNWTTGFSPTTVNATFSGLTSIAGQTMDKTGFSNVAVNTAPDIFFIYTTGSPAANVTLTFNKPIKNPVLHIAGVGGFAGANLSSLITLEGGLTWTELSQSSTSYVSDATTLYKNLADAVLDASGSMQINGTVSTISLAITTQSGSAVGADGIRVTMEVPTAYTFCQDTDNDGIPDSLDLDSDGDGCSDALEGGANLDASSLVISTMAGGNSGGTYTGTSTNPVVKNLGNTVNTTASSASYGVPTIAGTGQTIGNSVNGAVLSPNCIPCNAGTTAPTLSATTKSNVCPAITADISSLVSSTCPVGSGLEWHTVSTGFSAANKVADATIVGVGIYYPVCFDAVKPCYSPAPVSGVIVTIVTCIAITQPATQTGAINTPKSGTVPSDITVTGGTGTITYSNGSTDPACIAPSGATALPGSSNLMIGSNGSYSYTIPATVGTYYFCVKVCDSTTPTPDCKIATYTVNALPPPCNVGPTAPKIN